MEARHEAQSSPQWAEMQLYVGGSWRVFFLAIGASELLRGFSASGRYNADPGSARASAWYYVVVQFVAARPHLPLHPTASESESCSTGHGRVQTPSRDPILTGSGGSGTVGVHARILSPVRTAVLPGPTALSYDAGGLLPGSKTTTHT